MVFGAAGRRWKSGLVGYKGWQRYKAMYTRTVLRMGDGRVGAFLGVVRGGGGCWGAERGKRRALMGAVEKGVVFEANEITKKTCAAQNFTFFTQKI